MARVGANLLYIVIYGPVLFHTPEAAYNAPDAAYIWGNLGIPIIGMGDHFICHHFLMQAPVGCTKAGI